MAYENPNSLTAAAVVPAISPLRSKSPKYIRSKDRCHIMSRTPVYDKNGKLFSYVFRYTAGEESFRPDMVEKKHVRHIIVGFYVRRHSELFTQKDGMSMTLLPLCPEITKYAKPLPATRFILHLPERQDSSASYQHQISVLKREGMQIAADAYTIVYTNWFSNLMSINFCVIDMTQDIEEQFILAKNIVKKAPWIKIICDRCDNINRASIAFEQGADYVSCPSFPRDVLKVCFNPQHYKIGRNTYERVLEMLENLLEMRPDYQKFIELISQRKDLLSLLPSLISFIDEDEDGRFVTDLNDLLMDLRSDTLHKLICVVCLILLEEFYQASDFNNRAVRYISYEPLRQVLLRAKFIEELAFCKAQAVDTSWAFSLGVCSNISLMYAYTTPNIVATLGRIQAKIQNAFTLTPEYKTILKIAMGMESHDYAFVDECMNSKFITRHEILFSYENAVMWLSALPEAIIHKRF